jgi:hypothetical protein
MAQALAGGDLPVRVPESGWARSGRWSGRSTRWRGPSETPAPSGLDMLRAEGSAVPAAAAALLTLVGIVVVRLTTLTVGGRGLCRPGCGPIGSSPASHFVGVLESGRRFRSSSGGMICRAARQDGALRLANPATFFVGTKTAQRTYRDRLGDHAGRRRRPRGGDRGARGRPCALHRRHSNAVARLGYGHHKVGTDPSKRKLRIPATCHETRTFGGPPIGSVPRSPGPRSSSPRREPDDVSGRLGG